MKEALLLQSGGSPGGKRKSSGCFLLCAYHCGRIVFTCCGILWSFKCTLLYAVAFVIVVLRTRRELLALDPVQKHEIVCAIGLAFLMLTVPPAIHLSWQHLSNFVEPRQQSQTVRIIWTVPVYAGSAWLCLRFPRYGIYIQGVREFYEAYVIYCFLQYLVYYLGEDRSELARKLTLKPAIVGHHKPPFCCLSLWAMGSEFLDNCKISVLQQVCVRFCTTLAASLTNYYRCYGEGHVQISRGFLWITLANSMSQGWAFYVLFLFYHATHWDMAAIAPLGKFLTIKAVVFFSY